MPTRDEATTLVALSLKFHVEWGNLNVTRGSSRVTSTLWWTIVRVSMDLFQHRYYRLNKLLMTFIGQWPYQKTGTRRGCLAALIFLTGNQILPLSLALVKYRNDGKLLLDAALVLLFAGVFLTKIIGFAWNSEKTLKLLNRICTNWHEWAHDREVNTLRQYAEQGRKITIAYLVINITSNFAFMTQPIIPKIIDVFLRNGTEPGIFPIPLDFYYFDVQKYYFYIIAYSYVCSFMAVVVVVTHDLMLICYVQHICGIFTALGHKLERLGNNRALLETREKRYALDKRDRVVLTTCIDRHHDAIEYVKLIAASYTWTFFFTIGFGMILFNATALQLFLRINDPESSIKFIYTILALTLYFYIECYISERVVEHGITIYFCIHNSQWYKLSLHAQKLLQFMMIQWNRPCQLTAGKMLIMSMRSFWLTTKTAISYFTLVRSVQGL